MRQTKNIYLALLAVLLTPMAANAGPITWTGESLNGDGTTDISTVGTLVEAHNTGGGLDTTAGGILFDDTETNPLGLIFSGANPGNITGDANFDSILNTASFAVTDIIFTIDGLTDGVSYLAQFFVADSRAGPAGRTVTLDDMLGNALTSGAIGNGYAFTGLFTATGSTQDIRFSSVDPVFGSVPYMNAWQLRARSVPEPGTLVLLGLGLVGIAARRRKI